MAVGAGCFADEPAIPPMDLAACTSDDVDRALRKKALDNVARFGMPKGLPGTSADEDASPPVAFLSHLYSSGSSPPRKTSRARRVFGIKKKVAAVSGALH